MSLHVSFCVHVPLLPTTPARSKCESSDFCLPSASIRHVQRLMAVTCRRESLLFDGSMEEGGFYRFVQANIRGMRKALAVLAVPDAPALARAEQRPCDQHASYMLL